MPKHDINFPGPVIATKDVDQLDADGRVDVGALLVDG